jgi:hypothetical protein
MTLGQELLRSLGAGIRPGEAGAVGAPGRAMTPAELANAPFARLLERARSEEPSGKPVRVMAESGVRLSDEQMQRLSQAADRAEREGATRAVVLIDGAALMLDVGVRTITGVVDQSKGAITGIDAVIRAPEAVKSNVGVPGVCMPGASRENASLMRALAERE